MTSNSKETLRWIDYLESTRRFSAFLHHYHNHTNKRFQLHKVLDIHDSHILGQAQFKHNNVLQERIEYSQHHYHLMESANNDTDCLYHYRQSIKFSPLHLFISNSAASICSKLHSELDYHSIINKYYLNLLSQDFYSGFSQILSMFSSQEYTFFCPAPDINPIYNIYTLQNSFKSCNVHYPNKIYKHLTGNDALGVLYALDFHLPVVDVLSFDSRYIASYYLLDRSNNHLPSPKMIHLTDSYLYVLDSYNTTIYQYCNKTLNLINSLYIPFLHSATDVTSSKNSLYISLWPMHCLIQLSIDLSSFSYIHTSDIFFPLQCLYASDFDCFYILHFIMGVKYSFLSKFDSSFNLMYSAPLDFPCRFSHLSYAQGTNKLILESAGNFQAFSIFPSSDHERYE